MSSWTHTLLFQKKLDLLKFSDKLTFLLRQCSVTDFVAILLKGIFIHRINRLSKPMLAFKRTIVSDKFERCIFLQHEISQRKLLYQNVNH